MEPPVYYILSGPEVEARLARYAQEMDYEEVNCPLDDGHPHMGKRLTNLNIILPGKTAPDFAWTWLNECLMTDRVLRVLKTNGLTGFTVRPVRARFRRSEEEPPPMWELIVSGWAGLASPDSGIRMIKNCPACGYQRYSSCEDPSRLVVSAQWDGSDFFMVWPLPKYIFVTERAAQVIRGNRLKGAHFKFLDDLVFCLSGGFSPGRLSYWMPEERARELGEPLGIY